MFSRLVSRVRRTAAWRLSALTAVAFAVGTGTAFLIAYLVVARGIHQRSDAWLLGESEVLAQVAETAPPGDLQAKMIEEVAQLARQEVLPAPGEEPGGEQPVFFLITSPGGEPRVWMGPGSRDQVAAAVHGAQWGPGAPFSIDVTGWEHPFRVAAHDGAGGDSIYLGFFDQNADALLHEVKRTFLWLWSGMLLFGLVISTLGARHILHRVEQLTETAARVGREGLHERVPAGPGYDEIARLAATLNDMLQRIEVSVKQIRAVTDGVAHDLRSPVTAIRGNLEVALTRSDPADLRESAASALEDLDRLLRILDTSLDVAEAEAGALRLNRQPVDLAQLAREMEEIYRPVAEESGLTLEASGEHPVVVSADADLTRRALANLLDNAMQHLPRGCRVTVAAASDGRTVTLSVVDDGPGLPEEIRLSAFDRFVKGPGSRGYGLGLALVRATARAHGGEACIQNNSRGGAVVLLSFPVR
jgi:signal transduction histidine kinase